MTCSNGHQVPEGQRFCGTCGQSVADVWPPRPPEASQPAKRKGRTSNIVAAVLVVIVLGGLALIATTQGKDDKPDPARTRDYQQSRAFCEARGTAAAQASNGLHSVGGDWWVDQVNACLLSKD